MSKGGARPGAGRKPLPCWGDKKVSLSVSVTAGTQEKARDLKAAGFDLNAEIEAVIIERWRFFVFPEN